MRIMTEKEELEIINTYEELEIKNKYLINNPYSPNKVIYQGKPSVIYNSRVIDIAKNRISEDYFHKGYFFLKGNGRTIYKISKVYIHKSSFDLNNSDTWIRVDYTKLSDGINYLETIDFERYKEVCNGLILMVNGDDEIFVVDNSEMLLSIGFIKGTVNSNYWFHKDEIKYLDKMLTYKKFDHTIWKKDIKELELACKADGYTSEETKLEITKAINDNIKFGVDSITYKQFEGIRYTFGRRKIS